jgi:REP element-mobilizing transposase RayT
MRKARIKVAHLTAVYHCISRIVGEEYLLDDGCKETFRSYMWQQADFAGLQILTYCLMTNHIHILLRVLAPSEISDTELIERVQALYGPEARETLRLREDLERRGKIPRKTRERLLKRMGDVSAFMKELKQRFSGYGEALGGDARARAGLLKVMGTADWAKGSAEYRVRLYVEGGKAGESGKVVFDREEILKVVRAGGVIGCGEALRLRIRYFGDGLVLGSEAYVNGIFQEFRSHFGPNRRTGARKLRWLPFVELRTLRDLKKNVLS